jgi:hypothetical protein
MLKCQTYPLRFGGKERLEQLLTVLRSDPFAGIGESTNRALTSGHRCSNDCESCSLGRER